MEPSQPTSAQQNVYSAKPASAGKLPVTISLLVACLVFLLPFVEIKCNGTPLAQASGLDLAMGFDMKPSGSMKSLSNFGESVSGNTATTSTATQKQKPNNFAIAALGLGVLALLIAFLSRPGNKIIGVISILAIVALIALMVDLKAHAKDQVPKEQDNPMDMGVKITVDFTMWYFLSVLGFGVAAIYSLRKRTVQPIAVAQPMSTPGTTLSTPPADSSTAQGAGTGIGD